MVLQWGEAPTAEVLAQSVLPIFVPDDHDNERPERAGSCVLVGLFGQHFVVTARHVFGPDIRKRQQIFVGKTGSKLIRLRVPGIYTIEGPPRDGLDVAVMHLGSSEAAERLGFVFIPERSVEKRGDLEPSASKEFVAFGWPDSHSQFRLNRPGRRIRQNSFLLRTTAATPAVAARIDVDHDEHLVLEFNPEQMSIKGKRHNPPNPRGMSGGAVFRVIDQKLRLAAILTEHHRTARAIVGVRMSEVLTIADHIVRQERRAASSAPSELEF